MNADQMYPGQTVRLSKVHVNGDTAGKSSIVMTVSDVNIEEGKASALWFDNEGELHEGTWDAGLMEQVHRDPAPGGGCQL